MDRELTITPILLNHQPHPGPKSWVKLLEYQPTDAAMLATRGQMYAVLSLSSAADIDFTPLMGMIIETLHQKYFNQPEGGILQALEVALDAIHKQLLLAGQQDKRLSGGFSFDILVAVNWGTVLYLGQLGSSRACLVREEKLHDIDEGEQKSASSFLSSGVVKAEDRFLLATSQLLAKFSRKQLLHQLSLQPDTLAASLEQQLDHQPTSLESGIILVVDIKQVPSIEEESLRIIDSDTGVSARLSGSVKNVSKMRVFAFEKAKSGLSKLWHWHLFGKVPALPIVIIVICLAGLAGSIAWSHSPGSKPKTVDVTPTVKQLQDQLTQAQQISTINPDRASDLLGQMQPTLDNTLKISSDPRLKTIQSQRQQLQDQLLNIQTLTPHPLATTSNQPAQAKLVMYNNSPYFISTNGQLVRLKGESVQLVASNPNLFTKTTKLVATTEGLVAVSNTTITPVSDSGQAKTSQKLNNEATLSATGYQQNAYRLSTSGQLYRYANQGDATGTPSSYFPTAISQDGLIDVAIDGSVYVLRQDGSVTKYLNGQAQTFSLERSDLAAKARAIFTSEQTQNLYTLADHSLLVWDKNGQYVGQYRLNGSATWQAATVDATGKRLYILTEGKLVDAELPQ